MKVLLKTNHGDITLELDTQAAPKTCENFAQYVNDGHYNNTIFHRVIPGFMVQGGGFESGMNEKNSRETIINEANNGLENEIGTIAMARTNEPHSASAQFFINLSNNEFLNFKNESVQGWGYCVFGKTVDGMDAVNSIAKVETGSNGMHQDVPQSDVILESAQIID